MTAQASISSQVGELRWSDDIVAPLCEELELVEKQLAVICNEEQRLGEKRQQLAAELQQHAAKREELAKEPRISSVAAGSSSAPQAEPYWAAWGLDTFRRLEAWLQQRRAVVLTDTDKPVG